MDGHQDQTASVKKWNNLSGLTFFIKTYGCQTNVYDSNKISLLLELQDMTEVGDPEQADALLFVTCHIREKARHKLYSELGTFSSLKQSRARAGKPLLVAVGGCVAQAEGTAMFKIAPYVDVVFGPKTYHRVPELLSEALYAWNRQNAKRSTKGAKPYTTYQKVKVYAPHLINIEEPTESKFNFLPKTTRERGSAFLAIQEGCDKFCAYCVVPHTRGREHSRLAEAILEEAQAMVQQGIVEITVLGQNVNAYNGLAPRAARTKTTVEKEETLRASYGPYPTDVEGERWTFAQLLRALGQVKGLKRIFYTSSHPLDVSSEQIQAHADIPAVMPFFQLPVQSGSDNILRAMNRRHTAQDYKKIIDSVRALNRKIAFCSDFIVGFPGETEEDFQATLEMVRYVQYAQAFSFKYSPRPGTVAAQRVDQVEEQVKTRRLLELQALLGEQQRAFNESCLGETVSVLFQRFGKRSGQILGKSEFMQSVVVDVPDDPRQYMNTLRRVRVQNATQSCLTGVFED